MKGNCVCGKNEWNLSLTDNILTVICLYCGYKIEFTVDVPFLNIVSSIADNDNKELLTKKQNK